MGIAVIGVRHTPETFLSSGVPDLQFDARSIDDNNFVLFTRRHCNWVMCVFVMQKEKLLLPMKTQLLHKMQLIYEMCMPKRKWMPNVCIKTQRWGEATERILTHVTQTHCVYAAFATTCRHIKHTRNTVIQLQVTFKYDYKNFNDTDKSVNKINVFRLDLSVCELDVDK